MTKYSFLRLRLLRTIREWICSANMIDIEHFTKIFYSLGEIDRSIVKKYIHGDSIRNISRCLGYSESFIYERIYKFHKKIRKVSRHEKAQDFDYIQLPQIYSTTTDSVLTITKQPISKRPAAQ